jgi:hypothetical protein
MVALHAVNHFGRYERGVVAEGAEYVNGDWAVNGFCRAQLAVRVDPTNVSRILAIGLEEFNGITVVHVVLSHFVRFGVVPQTSGRGARVAVDECCEVASSARELFGDVGRVWLRCDESGEHEGADNDCARHIGVWCLMVKVRQ